MTQTRKPLGSIVTLQGKAYKVVVHNPRGYVLELGGQRYKIGFAKLARMEAGLPPTRRAPRARQEAPQFPPMSQEQIIAKLQSIDNELSPENLHCDGEISQSAATKKYRILMKQKKELEGRLGRPLTTVELYGR